MHIALATILFMSFLYNNNCSPSPTYTTKYDSVDLDEILASERLLTSYVNCLLDQGPCTPDGRELKTNLPDAIANECKNCTDRQREGADKVMHYIIDNRPDDWDKLEHKYKSDGSYKKQYLESKHLTEINKQVNNDIEEININNIENKE